MPAAIASALTLLVGDGEAETTSTSSMVDEGVGEIETAVEGAAVVVEADTVIATIDPVLLVVAVELVPGAMVVVAVEDVDAILEVGVESSVVSGSVSTFSEAGTVSVSGVAGVKTRVTL